MNLTVYNSATDFLASVSDFFEEAEITNCLIYGISLANKNLEHDQTHYLSITNNGSIQLALIKTVGHKIILSGASDIDSLYIQTALDYLNDNQISIPGFVGLKELVQKFKDIAYKDHGLHFETEYHHQVYVLENIPTTPNSSGEMRLAELKDLEMVTKWFHLFLAEAMNTEDENEAKKIAYNKIRNKECYLWETNNQAVSMASIARPTPNGISINYVYTSPSDRKMGYGTQLVAELSKQMIERGFSFCTLFADLQNSTSNNIYRKIGYQSSIEFQVVRTIK